jgi:LacI family transcriptional regulator
MEKRVSLKDIARKSGVSIATVSYVLNGQEDEKRIRKEVVDRIRKSAEELNYQPNQIARSLRKRSSSTIGMIVADIANPFFSQMARIVENEAADNGYTVIFGSSDEDAIKSEALINSFLNRQVDGLIIVPAEGSEAQIINLVRRRFPMVLVDRYFPDINTCHVCLDNFQATYDATLHLAGKKVTDITLVAYSNRLIHMRERIRGYREAMKVSGLTGNISVHEIGYGDDHVNELEKILVKVRENGGRSRGFIFATNALSVSGLFAIRNTCLKMPKDISFIGFDGGDSFDLFDPPLSYVEQPLGGFGKESVHVLLELIRGSTKITRIQLSPKLIIREGKNC